MASLNFAVLPDFGCHGNLGRTHNLIQREGGHALKLGTKWICFFSIILILLLVVIIH